MIGRVCAKEKHLQIWNLSRQHNPMNPHMQFKQTYATCVVRCMFLSVLFVFSYCLAFWYRSWFVNLKGLRPHAAPCYLGRSRCFAERFGCDGAMFEFDTCAFLQCLYPFCYLKGKDAHWNHNMLCRGQAVQTNTITEYKYMLCFRYIYFLEVWAAQGRS